MNANTLKAITRHGETLLRAFPNAIEKTPVALCKKLRRIENAVAKPILDYTNGDNGVTTEMVDAACERAKVRVLAVLGEQDGVIYHCGFLHINRDPRGHALKLDDAWTREWNHRCYVNNTTALHTDMGGYGIIAPDLTTD